MVTKSCAPLLNQPISENCLSNCLSLVPDNPSQVPNPSLGSPSLERTTRLWFRTACFRSRQPVSGTAQPSRAQWTATNSPHTTSVLLFSPASASVGGYILSLRFETRTSVSTHSLGQFMLL